MFTRQPRHSLWERFAESQVRPKTVILVKICCLLQYMYSHRDVQCSCPSPRYKTHGDCVPHVLPGTGAHFDARRIHPSPPLPVLLVALTVLLHCCCTAEAGRGVQCGACGGARGGSGGLGTAAYAGMGGEFERYIRHPSTDNWGLCLGPAQ